MDGRFRQRQREQNDLRNRIRPSPVSRSAPQLVNWSVAMSIPVAAIAAAAKAATAAKRRPST
jgi:hypothetical protein